MKTLSILLLSSFFLLIGCRATSDDLGRDSAKLTIFHTNDIMGYLTPCG
ncbi:hypothetical protein JW998_16845 [candidate division KSB1 bacterium]|nr:hypothetical protein [candidate division KSB1 bacterium]